ncbi:MAG: class I tRNA ligase family protein, partial [Nitrospirales bacterium]|nr:class I tRNA ligase family protein [Nitrospirales bacterium]
MAPILSFTAEEIWHILPEKAKDTPSVHMSALPKANARWADPALAERWARLLASRQSVQAELEGARRDKVIGASLEAAVILEAGEDEYDLLKQYDLPSLYIVSQVVLKKATDLAADTVRVGVSVSTSNKCERCWNYREAVGIDKEHPTLCDRCLEAIR